MSEGVDNLHWARTLMRTLAAGGLERVVVAPGSRSTPLVLAAFDTEELTVDVHLDERSAGFYALGRGRATGRPTAVVTTSGTATANLHPAVIEASHSRVPLLIMTADRPPELHESDANQTMEQRDLYGDAVRWSRSLPEVRDEPARHRAVAAIGARAIAEATGADPGPVHLNCPFRKPLQPMSAEELTEARSRELPPIPRVNHPQSSPEVTDLRWLISQVESFDRGLIVVGPACFDREAADTIISFAELVGYPILADPVSGLRFHPSNEGVVCGGYDGYLTGPMVRSLDPPELVIRIGPPPTSQRLQTYLDTPKATQVLLDATPRWRDPTYRIDTLITGDPIATLSAAADELTGLDASGWFDRFGQAESVYWSTAESVLAGRYFEGAIARAVASVIPEGTALFVSNSMPVRDLDRFGEPRAADVHAFGNRGVSGIDGIVSSALGVGDALDAPVVILTGDLALYHDSNGLEAIERFDLDATVIVINNDGGGIFHRLPIEDLDPPFEEMFKTPHGRTFEAIATQYGLGYDSVHGRTDLAEALGSVSNGGRTLIECNIDARRSHEISSFVTGELRNAVAEAITE